MQNHLSLQSPDRFGLSSFADLLPKRPPMICEDPGSFEGFRDGMMQSLTPFTPYECVIAENLVAIEWDLLQHRRMRDASIRASVREALIEAVIKIEQDKHEAALDDAWAEYVEDGGDEEADWKEPFAFDEDAAREAADALAARATSPDPELRSRAYNEILELGLSTDDLIVEAHRGLYSEAERHDKKTQDLERRRRDVKKDYDALQRTRPIYAEVIDG